MRPPLPVLFGHDHTGAPFYLTPEQRNLGLHLMGMPNVGKSCSTEVLTRHDLRDPGAGGGLYLDPHGQSFHNLRRFCARYQPRHPVSFVNPSSGKSVVPFAPFAPRPDGDTSTRALRAVMTLFKAYGISNPADTRRLYRWAKNVFTLTMERADLAISEFDLLFDPTDRGAAVRAYVAHGTSVEAEWLRLNTYSRKEFEDQIESVRNMLDGLISARTTRRFLSVVDPARTFDLGRDMEEGVWRVVNLQPSPDLDPRNASVIGTLLLSEVYDAIRQRQRRGGRLPRPYSVVVDECHLFATPELPLLFAEGRKFGLQLCVAHQFRGQLRREHDDLLAALDGACGTQIIFRVGSDTDAKELVHELYPNQIPYTEVKYLQPQTKYEPVAAWARTTSETRGGNTGTSAGGSDSVARGQSRSAGRTDTQSSGSSEAHSDGWTETHGEGSDVSEGTSHGTTKGTSHTHGTSRTVGATHTTGRGRSWTRARGVAYGRARGQSHSEGHVHTETEQHASAHAYSTTSSHSDGETTSDDSAFLATQTATDTEGTSQTFNESDSWGRSDTRSENDSTTESESVTHSRVRSHGGSESESDAETWTAGDNDSDTDSDGESDTTSASRSWSENDSDSESESDTYGTNESESTGKTKTRTNSRTRTRGTNWANSRGQSWSAGSARVPVTQHRAFREDAPQFYTREEQRQRYADPLRVLPLAGCVVRGPDGKAHRVQVVPLAPIRLTDSFVERYEITTDTKSGAFTPEEVDTAIADRRRRIEDGAAAHTQATDDYVDPPRPKRPRKQPNKKQSTE